MKSEKIIFPDVEIVEYGKLDPDRSPNAVGHVAAALRINGIEFHCPTDSVIEIQAGPNQLTALTATIYVGEVSVHREERNHE